MTNVVISNRSIINQKIVNIEKNRVALPFNVTKEQSKKLIDLLSKINVTFLAELDKLSINNLKYNDVSVKATNRQLSNNRFTLSKTYVVTMKQSFITKVKTFYEKVVEEKAPERPIFSIGNETNLQAALAEATAEIDLSTINASLNNNQNMQANASVPPTQVLANNPLGETVIENPVNLNNNIQQVSSQTPIVDNNSTIPTVNNTVEQQANNVNIPVQPTQTIQPANPQIITVTPEVNVQPKVKVKKLKGSVLIVPIVLVWLGAVFYGTLKLVTSILT